MTYRKVKQPQAMDLIGAVCDSDLGQLRSRCPRPSPSRARQGPSSVACSGRSIPFDVVSQRELSFGSSRTRKLTFADKQPSQGNEQTAILPSEWRGFQSPAYLLDGRRFQLQSRTKRRVRKISLDTTVASQKHASMLTQAHAFLALFHCPCFAVGCLFLYPGNPENGRHGMSWEIHQGVCSGNPQNGGHGMSWCQTTGQGGLLYNVVEEKGEELRCDAVRADIFMPGNEKRAETNAAVGWTCVRELDIDLYVGFVAVCVWCVCVCVCCLRCRLLTSCCALCNKADRSMSSGFSRG